VAVIFLESVVAGTMAAIAATAAPTTAPTPATDGYNTEHYVRVRTLMLYTGQVDTCAVQLWVRDRNTGIWYRGANTADVDPLVPGGASPVNEARAWDVGRQQEAYWTISAITGGGTVAVRLQPVDTGLRFGQP
jgi:hypothetical protein